MSPPTRHAGQEGKRRLGLLRISANVTEDFGNVTGLSGRC